MTDYHGPAAVLLQGGRVLVAGDGDEGDGTRPLPARGLRPARGRSPGGRLRPCPASNGQVLSVGDERLANCTPKGCGSEPVASGELYTP
jgi:hypothetical protein